MKESQVEKVQKELNEKMLNSVMSYGEVLDIITKDFTYEQKVLFEEDQRLGWAKDNLELGKIELIREQTITEDGTIIIRFLKVSPDEDEEEP